MRVVCGIIFAVCLICNSEAVSNGSNEVKSVSVPEMKPVKIKKTGKLGRYANIEPSGIIKSRVYENVFWSQNDSGDEPRIFAHTREGKIYPTDDGLKEGIRIPDAVNVDWEDITNDNHGHIIVGDVGNREINNRRDFALYWVLEPHPQTNRISVFKKIFYTFPEYPDYSEFPVKENNFDCEGIFWANEKIYLISKNRANTYTSLYRLDSEIPFAVNTLTYLDTFDIGDNTTAADASPDGRRLVITTYSAIWLFEVEQGNDNYFDGKISWLPIDVGENEAVCFDGETLIITAEEGVGDIYEVPLRDLKVLRE
jgi:DNA-binding beta-propeller fold protein YncE